MSKVAQSSLLEWSRQPKESAKAHQAAREYFEIGAGRSLCAVAKKVQKSISLIERWSGKWSWVTRARALDAHLACQEEQASELERNKRRATWLLRKEEHSERLFQLANKMEAKADKMLDLPLTTITQANGKLISTAANGSSRTLPCS